MQIINRKTGADVTNNTSEGPGLHDPQAAERDARVASTQRRANLRPGSPFAIGKMEGGRHRRE